MWSILILIRIDLWYGFNHSAGRILIVVSLTLIVMNHRITSLRTKLLRNGKTKQNRNDVIFIFYVNLIVSWHQKGWIHYLCVNTIFAFLWSCSCPPEVRFHWRSNNVLRRWWGLKDRFKRVATNPLDVMWFQEACNVTLGGQMHLSRCI